MQSARLPQRQWMTPLLVALPLSALLGIGAAVVTFFLLTGLPTTTPTAAPIPIAESTPIAPTPQPAFFDTPIQALPCTVANPDDTDLLIRSAPADTFAPLGLLSAGSGVQALGKTMTDPVWYAVGYAERRGWVAQQVAALQGDCSALPVVHNPLVPDAPEDPPAHVIAIDRDGSGIFHEAISMPGGDTSDLVWVRVINLYTDPPSNFREFTLTLTCSGTDADDVRWGDAGSPSLRCDQSMTIPFIYGSSDRPLTIQFMPMGMQGYIEYALHIEQAKRGDSV